ncbi:MAG TPA: hypothetical protein PLV25_05095 [Opitutales bacterium]|nr:hypothetical protein [Opitutales bacterium]
MGAVLLMGAVLFIAGLLGVAGLEAFCVFCTLAEGFTVLFALGWGLLKCLALLSGGFCTFF